MDNRTHPEKSAGSLPPVEPTDEIEEIHETNYNLLSSKSSFGDDVAFLAEGCSEEAHMRAKDCSHNVYRWHLHDSKTNEWRKECIFCPAVLEQRFTQEFPG